jgi:6-methylpretetramide 4-monooxygenase / 4-hydroxy-6-methylpretetramide 12a-monooxygenase
VPGAWLQGVILVRKDVLIIGAGPSGLFAASELARHGVDARLVEREVRPHHEARATTIQPGTLEILDSVGLLPPFLETAEHVHRVRLYDPDMFELGALDFEGIDCGCEFQCSLPQYETQRILEAHLASLGGAVERGVTATKVETDGDDLSVELMHADGEVEMVHPDFVIGAGGAHSVTRHSMSELLEGATYQGHFLVADIAMEAPVPRDQTSFFCGPNGLMLLAPLPGGRWLTSQDLEETVQTVSAEDVVVRTEARIGGRSRPTDVAWASPFPRIASGDSYGNPLDDVDPVAALIPCLFAVERLCLA